MYILPAIDLKDGKVVRLYKGDFNKVHQVAQDPLETARAFSEAGARWIHMVDLDGARGGTRINGGIVAEVTARSGLQVELGGGIRCMEDLEAVSYTHLPQSFGPCPCPSGCTTTRPCTGPGRPTAAGTGSSPSAGWS